MSLILRGDDLAGDWLEPGIDEPASVTLRRVVRPQSGDLRRDDIVFESEDGTALAGTIVMPEGSGPFPGVVLVHGSGPQPREASGFIAEEFARAGIAALIYDKRGVGESGGDWRSVGFESLAEDAKAAADLLGRQAGVDSVMIGFQGQSQGGWIAPLAATYRPLTAFMVLVSGPWTTPAIEGHWSHLWQARQEGAEPEELNSITQHLLLRDEAVRSGAWDAYLQDIEDVKDEVWFTVAGLDPTPGPPADWEFYRLILDFDPVPIFRRLEIPVLSVFGALDESIPALESARRLRRMAGEFGKPFEAVVYENANHAIRVMDVDGRRVRWPGYPHGYVSDITEWILAKTGG